MAWKCSCKIERPDFMRRCSICGGISPDAAELCARIAEDVTHIPDAMFGRKLDPGELMLAADAIRDAEFAEIEMLRGKLAEAERERDAVRADRDAYAHEVAGLHDDRMVAETERNYARAELARERERGAQLRDQMAYCPFADQPRACATNASGAAMAEQGEGWE